MSDHEDNTTDSSEEAASGADEESNEVESGEVSSATEDDFERAADEPAEATDPPDYKPTGPLAWMARNAVAANIFMIVLLVGGYFKLGSIKKEVFPEFDLDIIIVQVPYPNATPKQVESGVLQSTEEAIRGIDGVKQVRTTAVEGLGIAFVELLLGTDSSQALNDVKASMDRITTFPKAVEKHNVFMARNSFQVVSLAISGNQPEATLRALAEEVRRELLQDKRITKVTIDGIRPPEIVIEVPHAVLTKYGWTMEGLAKLIAKSSVELPAGSIKSTGTHRVLTMDSRARSVHDYEKITVFNDSQGNPVTLGDIDGVSVRDTFAENDVEASYNDNRAVMVNVFRVGSQTPLDISAAVKKYVKEKKQTLPAGVSIDLWFDFSEFYQGRVDLLVRNALLGLILVLIILGLFLEVKLAFWVTMGIPISFIGSLLFLGGTDVSINMISLFAFIVVLGMVVDDAIIVGEAIFTKRQAGVPPLRAAVEGVREVAMPVVFAIVTTMLAYMPMLFVPGPAGKFFRVIPIVVIIVLFLSLVESLLILPAHLAHSKPSTKGVFGAINRVQQRFSRFMESLIHKIYKPFVTAAVRRRYLTLCLCMAIFIGTIGLVAGGRLKSTFLPKVDGDIIFAQAELPVGESIERTKVVQQAMLRAAKEIVAEAGGTNLVRGVYAQVGALGAALGDPNSMSNGATGSHITMVAIYLVDAGSRSITASEFARRWKKKLADTAGIEKLTFQFETGPQAGASIHVELSHPDTATLQLAAKSLAKQLGDFEGTEDIDDGITEGKQRLNLPPNRHARRLGLDEFSLGGQVRGAFFGSEVERQTRDRDELRVYVRLPLAERSSEYNLEEFLIRTPTGGSIPLVEAVNMERGRTRMSIERIDGRRAVAVTADVDEAEGNAVKIMTSVKKEILPELVKLYPGLAYTIGGERQQMEEVNASLKIGFLLVLLGIFALLAVAFRSYVQPIIVLVAIPFGAVGALWGHMLMGFNLSMMSTMGIVALAGVVINDSLILVVSVNRNREDGMNVFDAAVAGGTRRFRPIILTSLTTFFGLAPMILETSVQARFLIPMALSLGFGVMFATVITLILVPAIYVIIDDIQYAGISLWNWERGLRGGFGVGSAIKVYKAVNSDERQQQTAPSQEAG